MNTLQQLTQDDTQKYGSSHKIILIEKDVANYKRQRTKPVRVSLIPQTPIIIKCSLCNTQGQLITCDCGTIRYHASCINDMLRKSLNLQFMRCSNCSKYFRTKVECRKIVINKYVILSIINFSLLIMIVILMSILWDQITGAIKSLLMTLIAFFLLLVLYFTRQSCHTFVNWTLTDDEQDQKTSNKNAMIIIRAIKQKQENFYHSPEKSSITK
ncbi:hypothetical protein pb186bvf_007731 [Paramecium bursaria]